ncbi:DUF418 domain-containing protein [Pseudonocardia oceani]|uniref:DUF418 domain-containing protein n=2 Tax=Pseudonocardia oceani TaxID=2792013 RepID=A0ABS6UFS3_9PSEU|nr:DUF418 domain-containing protein [Pseudonocardia oceani]MBW0091863.1 DUF418 domain-containing protein [Pseudonocardia oceani]MBW0111493.1 DUF418 domain-containing protein [Pseudonocardia oceani]MBW0125217.1 DUF418 domain-containing protein [Pseudonocardia oceani]MBW0131090.1 DUF418 domain-containing protein [Pseudonocardia oceani]
MTTAADPGATPPTARALAPDLARGGMLLLIALANVHTWLYGPGVGVRSYPGGLDALDRGVALVQMLLVDGRAYPLFALLFGYGITQLAWRRAQVGLAAGVVTALVRRRGLVLVGIGFLHGVLLFSGDIVGAYGLVAVVLAGVLVAGSDRTLVVTAVVGLVVSALISLLSGLPLPEEALALRSVAQPDPAFALVLRAVEWLSSGFVLQAVAVFGMVALGAWAARRRLLDEPAAHRALLVRVAVGGLVTAVVLGLPFALAAAELVPQGVGALVLGAGLHTVGGFAGGAGYAALFGLLALRAPGPVSGALVACGRRSLSCYLAQSVAFVVVMPAWTLALGERASVAQALVIAVLTWLVVLAVAVVSERAGVRGPAETLLRRLTYGAPRR